MCPVLIVVVSSKKKMSEREVVSYLIRQSELSRLVMVERMRDGRSKDGASGWLCGGWVLFEQKLENWWQSVWLEQTNHKKNSTFPSFNLQRIQRRAFLYASHKQPTQPQHTMVRDQRTDKQRESILLVFTENDRRGETNNSSNGTNWMSTFFSLHSLPPCQQLLPLVSCRTLVSRR